MLVRLQRGTAMQAAIAGGGGRLTWTEQRTGPHASRANHRPESIDTQLDT